MDAGFYVFKLPFLEFLVNWLIVSLIVDPGVHGGLPLPERRDPDPAGHAPGPAGGEGPPLGAAGAHRPGQGGRLRPGQVPAGHLDQRLRRGGRLHRRPRPDPGPRAPVLDLAGRGGGAALEHPPTGLDPADPGRRPVGVRGPRHRGHLPGHRPGHRQPVAELQGGPLHRPQHHGDPGRLRVDPREDVSSFAASTSLTAEQVLENCATLDNIRLWDPNPQISLPTFQKLQYAHGYYTFHGLAVDRYKIGRAPAPAGAGRACARSTRRASPHRPGSTPTSSTPTARGSSSPRRTRPTRTATRCSP